MLLWRPVLNVESDMSIEENRPSSCATSRTYIKEDLR